MLSVVSGPVFAQDAVTYLRQGDSFRGLDRGVQKRAVASWDHYVAGDAARLVERVEFVRENRLVEERALRKVQSSATRLAAIERSYLRDGLSLNERRYLARPYAELNYRLRRLMGGGQIAMRNVRQRR